MRSRSSKQRSLETLLVVVRKHIETGEPVGSHTVSRQQKDALSPASIRNIMMALEEEGYLEQPHTSAGRVPTDKAYRFYVSQIDLNEPPAKADEELILSLLGEPEQLSEEEVLERTSRVLSLVSNNLGVVVRLPMTQKILEHIHFINLGDRRILVILVSPGSQVQEHMIRVENEIPQPELEGAANYLNQHFRGWDMEQIRSELEARLAEERGAYDRLLSALRQLYDRGMLAESSPPEVFLEGASNLIGRPELADPAKLRELIKAVEQKENLIRLLNRCIGGTDDPLQVVIGLPGKPPLLKSFALIGSAFFWPGGPSGHMAILGPARMPYDRAIRAIGYVGRLLQQESN